MKPARRSAYGFYCDDCREFVYIGYDSRDIPQKTNAVCVDCAKAYIEVESK